MYGIIRNTTCVPAVLVLAMAWTCLSAASLLSGVDVSSGALSTVATAAAGSSKIFISFFLLDEPSRRRPSEPTNSFWFLPDGCRVCSIFLPLLPDFPSLTLPDFFLISGFPADLEAEASLEVGGWFSTPRPDILAKVFSLKLTRTWKKFHMKALGKLTTKCSFLMKLSWSKILRKIEKKTGNEYKHCTISRLSQNSKGLTGSTHYKVAYCSRGDQNTFTKHNIIMILWFEISIYMNKINVIFWIKK